jgi:hypothetical protein
VILGMELVPLVPLLLLPFILIFFIIIFPLWGAALGVLGLLLLIARGLNWMLGKAGVEAMNGVVVGLRRALRWVLTFGGFTERLTNARGAAEK